jgi:uncharacterized protein YeaO (DUF488 family)
MTKQRNVHAQRIYEDPSPQDGQRILVDRLWPLPSQHPERLIGPFSPTADGWLLQHF